MIRAVQVVAKNPFNLTPGQSRAFRSVRARDLLGASRLVGELLDRGFEPDEAVARALLIRPKLFHSNGPHWVENGATHA